ncbi:glycosyltransferase family 4 protein [Streptomyces sp. NPDC002577]
MSHPFTYSHHEYTDRELNLLQAEKGVRVRVLFSPDAFVRQRFGGISRYFAELHTELVDEGVDARLFAGLNDNLYVTGRRGDKLRKLPRRVRLLLSRASFRAYSATQRGRHVIHPTYYSPVVSGHQPQVCTFYDLIHHKYADYFGPKDDTAERQRFWARRADRIIAISKSTADDLVSVLGVEPEKISVIHLGVRIPLVRPNRNPDDYLLYVGNRGGYKNWRMVVDALQDRDLRAIRLICSGGGPATPAEKSFLEKRRLAHRVEFLQAGEETLSRLYQRALALVYPSMYEGFGLPPLEAMARGVPVVAARAASIPEVVGDAALLFDPHQCDDLISKLRCLDSSTCRELERRGPARAQTFTWKRTAQQTIDVYRTLLP